jgi:diguanylate cyclase (GGDEF)-like protein
VQITKPQPLKSGDQIHIGQRMARVFYRNTNTLSVAVDDLSETKPRVRELPLEPVDPRAALLYEVANRLTIEPNLEKALEDISDLIRDSMEAEKCGVIQSQHFERLGELGFSTSIAHRAIEKRLPVIISDLSGRTKKQIGKSGQLLSISTALCVPVLIGEEVAGLVYLYKTDPAGRAYDQNDAQLVLAISHQAALTIQRARLLEKAQLLEKWALTDALTGLYNRRQTLNLAELEFQRAQSLQRPLAMIMLDIDLFKRVNDTYGHPVGDHVLKAAAMRFKGQLRSIDTLGRYGGDEFMILLVDSGLEGAKAIAERLRQCIVEAPFETEHGLVSVTLSLGIAALTEDCAGLESLIDAADGALYNAKKAGRNRVKVAG